MRPELKTPLLVRLLFLAALVLIGLEAAGVIAPEDMPLAHMAIVLLAVAAVVWGMVALMRFRR
ncbi:hypothetical protein [Shimia marina]|uniref:hypothetical protein n=1 Tax=Shimia marina TaxID=321267 RepID=UPI00122CE001|nr:hypothetical protein [Shimia marina]